MSSYRVFVPSPITDDKLLELAVSAAKPKEGNYTVIDTKSKPIPNVMIIDWDNQRIIAVEAQNNNSYKSKLRKYIDPKFDKPINRVLIKSLRLEVYLDLDKPPYP